MRNCTLTVILATCLLVLASGFGYEMNLNETPEASHVGPTETTTAWGVSYDWSELPADIKDLTGLDIDQIITDLEDAADDGNINLDIDYGISGFTHYYVVQGPGQSTTIDLADGDDVDVDTIMTTITLRSTVDSSMGVDFDWADDDTGFDVDLDTLGDVSIAIDIDMKEYYTDDFEFAGMDMDVVGGLSINADYILDARIYAGNDAITFDETTISMGMDLTIDEMKSQWRMGEPSDIYDHITSGDYDTIEWSCAEENFGTYSESEYQYEDVDWENTNIGINSYDSYEDEWWNITTTHDAIALRFGQFETEGGYDYLQIRDGNTGQLLDSYSGYNSYQYTDYYPTNFLQLNFVSDGSYEMYGFDIDVINYAEEGEEHTTLWLKDDCGEVDYTWDVEFAYDFSLEDFPAEDLGFTSDQASFSLSDSMSDSGSSNNNMMEFYGAMIEIDNHDYEITDSDGTTRDVVRLSSGGPMLDPIGNLMDGGIDNALDGANMDDPREELEDESEEWEDDYDEDDSEVFDVLEDFEDTDLEDDMEEMAEELEDVMNDAEDSVDSKYEDATMYWLVDKDSGHQVIPQLLVTEDSDDPEEDWTQMIGPSGTDYEEMTESDDVELEVLVGEDAEDKQGEVGDMSLSDLQSNSASDEGQMMMYLLIAGLAVGVFGLIGLLLVVKGRGKDENPYMHESNVNDAFNQMDMGYGSQFGGMGAGMNPEPAVMPPAMAPSAAPTGPPQGMQGQVADDGFEWVQYPATSGTWYYRDKMTQQWVKHG